MGEITCSRCGQTGAAVETVAYSGDLGVELRQKVCEDCWSEWLQTEVIVINELRLDFMNPRSQDILIRHLREFLCLDGQTPAAS